MQKLARSPSTSPADPFRIESPRPQTDAPAIEKWPGAVRMFLIVGLSALIWTGILYGISAVF